MKNCLLILLMFGATLGLKAQITTHPETTIIGNYTQNVNLKVKGSQAQVYAISSGTKSSALNFQNTKGRWVLSDPRYEGKNQFSIFWNNGTNYINGTYFTIVHKKKPKIKAPFSYNHGGFQ